MCVSLCVTVWCREARGWANLRAHAQGWCRFESVRLTCGPPAQRCATLLAIARRITRHWRRAGAQTKLPNRGAISAHLLPGGMAVREWRGYSRGCPEYMVPSATAARCYAILLQNASLPLPLACLFVSLRARVEYARLRQVLVRKHTWDRTHERWRYSLLVEALRRAASITRTGEVYPVHRQREEVHSVPTPGVGTECTSSLCL